MKLVIVVLALAAIASGKSAPVTHSLAVGSDGTVGDSVFSPLVSLVININKALQNLVAIEGLPQPAETVVPEAVSPVVVPEAVVPETITPVVLPEPVAPVVIPEAVSPIVVPEVVAPVVVPEAVSPVVVPEGVAPVVLPEPVAPIVLPEPVAPVVIPEAVAPVVVPEAIIDGPEPVNVVDAAENTPVAAAGTEQESASVNNFFVNIFNFIMGDSSSGPLSTLPPALQQFLASRPVAASPRDQ